MSLKERVETECLGKGEDEIRVLQLDNCNSGGQIDGIFDAFTELEELSLSGCHIRSLAGFPALDVLDRLELADNNISQGLSALLKCSSLTKLTLSNNKIRDLAQLEPLKGLTLLRSLQLSDCPIADTDEYPDNVFELLIHVTYIDQADKDGMEEPSDDEDDSDDEDGGATDSEDEADPAVTGDPGAVEYGSEEDEDEEDYASGAGVEPEYEDEDEDEDDYGAETGGVKRDAEDDLSDDEDIEGGKRARLSEGDLDDLDDEDEDEDEYDDPGAVAELDDDDDGDNDVVADEEGLSDGDSVGEVDVYQARPGLEDAAEDEEGSVFADEDDLDDEA